MRILPGQPKSGWIRSLISLIAFALLIYLISSQGWEQVGEAFARIGWGRWIHGFAMVMLSRAAISGRWYLLLRSMGFTIGISQATRITLAGLFASNFLPSTIGGDVVRIAACIRLGIGKAASAASVIADRLMGLAAMAMALPLAVPSVLDWMAASGTGSGELRWFPHQAGLLASGASAPLMSRAKRFFYGLRSAFGVWLANPRVLGFGFLLTWLHMLGLFGMVQVTMEGLGYASSLWQVAGLWSIAYFVSILPVSLNGLGLQELTMTYVFAALAGMPVSDSLVLALVTRVQTLVASLPGVFFLSWALASDVDREAVQV